MDMRTFAWCAAVIAGLVAVAAHADTTSPDGIWTVLDIMPAAQQNAEGWVRPATFKALRLNKDQLKAALVTAPMEHTPEAAHPLRLTLPRPDGGFEMFDVVEYSMMEPGLAAQYPDIKTYLGQCVDEPASNICLDLTPQGFHAQ